MGVLGTLDTMYVALKDMGTYKPRRDTCVSRSGMLLHSIEF